MSSAYTIDLFAKQQTLAATTGLWREGDEGLFEKDFELSAIAEIPGRIFSRAVQTVTAMTDPWLHEEQSRDAVVTVHTATKRMLISELGWSREQALETRMRFQTFEEDWNAPGMEGYDEL